MLYDRRRFMLLATTALVGVAGGLALSETRASAGQNDAAVTIPVFTGQLGDASNVTLGSWGSGAAESSKQSVLIGDNSIKITTQGYYQGARLDFKNPVDLAPALLNPHTYLRFQFKYLGDNSTASSSDPRSGGGGSSGFEETKHAASPFAHMRFLLIMADGARYELIRPVEVPPTEDPDAYSPLAFPISALVKQLPAGKTLSGEGAKIKQMAIFGDRYAQFLVGEINVITDETEITSGRLEAPIAFAKQEVTLIASAEGGASTLHYSWDWDADDGVQEDSTGRVGTHTYQPSGKGSKTYKVTLTISDVDGLKKPTVETVDLDVSD